MIQNGRRDKKHHRGDDRQRCRTSDSTKVIPFRGSSGTTTPAGVEPGSAKVIPFAGRRGRRPLRGSNRTARKSSPFAGRRGSNDPYGGRTGQRDDYVESVTGYEKKKSHKGNGEAR